MTDRQLELFISCATCHSFSEAAKKNYLSLSSLVQQIDALENSIGFELFKRTNHGIQLTENGQKFYQTSVKILDLYHRTIEECTTNNIIRIAIAPTQIPKFLLKACNEYNKHYPEVKIEFKSLPFNEHLKSIAEVECDCTIIAEPSKKYLKDLESAVLCKDKCSFMMSENHPLSKKEIIHLEDLDGVDVICGHYSYMKRSFEQALDGSKANIISSQDEYNIQFKANHLFSKSIMIFHALWEDTHKGMMKVVPSSIEAGNVVMVYRKNSKAKMNDLIKYVRKELEGLQ